MQGATGPCVFMAVLVVSLGFALSVGRFNIPLDAVVGIVLDPLMPSAHSWSTTEAHVVWGVRIPRALLGGTIGAGLAVAGAALQSIFRNPLADTQILGVSSGAAFGGVLGIIFFSTGWPAMAGAFLGGLAALASIFWLAGGQRPQQGGTVMLVLAGLVVSAVGSAGIALLKYAADPDNQLPAVVFWLLGSLAAADNERLWIALVPIGVSTVTILGLRFHLSALAVGEEDANRLGIPVRTLKILALLATGMITAASVAVSGIIGWVGLVVPHLIRLSIGSNYRWFFLNTLLAGASYLIVVDTAARTLVAAEIPLGALTSLLGAPIFAILLRRLARERAHG